MRERHDAANAHEYDLTFLFRPLKFADQRGPQVIDGEHAGILCQTIDVLLGHRLRGEVIGVKVGKVLIRGKDEDVES